MKWRALALVVTVFLCSCSNKVEEAKKLIAENKKEEAIAILSQVETSDKLYSEAQKLIKQTKSDILYSKGLESFNNYKYQEALKYFEQVEDEGNSFPLLKKYKEEAKAGIELLEKLPGTYKGVNTPNLGGFYMIIKTKMKIDDDLIYEINEQMTDTYSGGFYNDLYTGKVKPKVTRFNSGKYGFILDLVPYNSDYRENDYSVYFYKYKNYWRLQFNLTFGSTQKYTLNLYREDSEEEKTGNNGS